MGDLPSGSTSRCLLVEAAATSALAGLWALAAPAAGGVVPVQGAAFDDVLVGGCAVAALVAGTWLWLVASVVVGEALSGRAAEAGNGARGVPRAVRTAVLAACGIALVAPMGPASAAEPSHPSQALHGLPMPDRATSTSAWVAAAVRSAAAQPDVHDAAPVHATRTHVVRTGDTLWSLAAADLSPTAAAGDVTRRWHRLHQLNRAVIGDDPDLIHPGQRLRLPPAAHRGDQP
jgi:nucleoid-associated protein YgaU